MRKHRLTTCFFGAIIGWGIAGLDGGQAITADVPAPRVDFVAAGLVSTLEHGSVAFDLASNGVQTRQVLRLGEDRLDMLADRQARTIVVIDHTEIVVLPAAAGFDDLAEPFARSARLADGPLDIMREGVGSHLGQACERYRATGTAAGRPLEATACITRDGIPLQSEIASAGAVMRTELTDLAIGEPDASHFTVPTDRRVIDMRGDMTRD